jgi:hypothetical protein
MASTRNFDCPATGTRCTDGRCKVGLCIAQQEYDAKSASQKGYEAFSPSRFSWPDTALGNGLLNDRGKLNAPIQPWRQDEPAREGSTMKPWTFPSRRIQVEGRIDTLIRSFARYLAYYDEHTPFGVKNPDQLKFHLATIQRRLEVGSAHLAATDPEFLENLYRTLQSWGIGRRGSRLVSYRVFADAIGAHSAEIADLDGIRIDELNVDAEQLATSASKSWRLISSLGIVHGISKLVSGTKALHHLLPDLIVPMDRTYTQRFFGLHNPQFQNMTEPDFIGIFAKFCRIAHSAEVGAYVRTGQPWRTSRTKVIDNAIVGFCIAEQLLDSSGALLTKAQNKPSQDEGIARISPPPVEQPPSERDRERDQLRARIEDVARLLDDEVRHRREIEARLSALAASDKKRCRRWWQLWR